MTALRLAITSIAFFTLTLANAQPARNIRVKIASPHPKLWEEVGFLNEDTIFYRWLFFKDGSNKAAIKDVPKGEYTVRIWSVFNDSFSMPATVRRGQKITFPLEDFYQIDTSKTSFFDRMKERDTLRIFSLQMVSGRTMYTNRTYCAIILDEGMYWIRFHVDTNVYVKYPLSGEEVNRLKEIEGELNHPGGGESYYFPSQVNYAFRLGRLVKKGGPRGGRSYILTLFEEKYKETEPMEDK